MFTSKGGGSLMGLYLVKAEIEKFLDLERRRLAKQREASDLEKEAKALKAKIRSYVEQEGGTDRTCTRSGFVLSLRSKAGTVPWMEEFIRVAGREEAERLRQEAPPSFVLVVEPAA